MPTYNVRLDSGDGPDDGEPMEFPDGEAARRDAQMALVEIARERIPGKRRARVGVEIDDDSGRPVYRAEMKFEGRDGQGPDSAPDTAEALPKGPRD